MKFTSPLLAIFLLSLFSCSQTNSNVDSSESADSSVQDSTSITSIEFDYAAAEDLTDPRDGKVYKTLQIVDQVWMAENLRFDAGDGSYCYDDDEKNCEEFGRLYTWSVAMQGDEAQGTQGVCPDGWHIPSDEDWDILIDNVGGENAGSLFKADGPLGFNGDLTGGRMALPDGGHKYIKEGTDVCFWSSESDSTGAYDRNLNNQDDKIAKRKYPKDYGFCVRCVKN